MLRAPRWQGPFYLCFISNPQQYPASQNSSRINVGLNEQMVTSLLGEWRSPLGNRLVIASVPSFECCWGDISQHLKVNLILENCPREFAGKYNDRSCEQEGPNLFGFQLQQQLAFTEYQPDPRCHAGAPHAVSPILTATLQGPWDYSFFPGT